MDNNLLFTHGDINVTQYVINGVFDTSKAEDGYTPPVNSSGLVIPASVGNISISGAINFKAGTNLVIRVNLTSNAGAGIYIKGNNDIDVSNAILTATTEKIKIESKEGSISASGLTATSNGGKGIENIKGKNNVDVSNAILTATTEKIKIESTNGAINASGLTATSNGGNGIEIMGNNDVDVSNANLTASNDVKIETVAGNIYMNNTSIYANGNIEFKGPKNSIGYLYLDHAKIMDTAGNGKNATVTNLTVVGNPDEGSWT